MSAKRRRRSIEWWDQAGNRHVDVSRLPAPATLGGIPYRERLVMANDDRGHLVAVLVGNGEAAPPVVMVRGPAGPTAAMLMLLADGLAAAVVFDDRIATIGTSRESFGVDCPDCGLTFLLPAAALREALSRTGRRTPGIVLDRTAVRR